MRCNWYMSLPQARRKTATPEELLYAPSNSADRGAGSNSADRGAGSNSTDRGAVSWSTLGAPPSTAAPGKLEPATCVKLEAGPKLVLKEEAAPGASQLMPPPKLSSIPKNMGTSNIPAGSMTKHMGTSNIPAGSMTKHMSTSNLPGVANPTPR
jgi:hypothetical protein